MTERICLTRKDDDKFDFSEDALLRIENLNMTHYVHQPVHQAAEDEFVAALKDLQTFQRLTQDEAFAYLKRTRPRLFALTRMERAPDARSADVIGEERG